MAHQDVTNVPNPFTPDNGGIIMPLESKTQEATDQTPAQAELSVGSKEPFLFTAYDSNGQPFTLDANNVPLTFSFYLVKITPALAAILLKLNWKNRPIDTATVRILARDMKNEGWDLTGDTIRVDNTGALLDGQHRLEGIVESGKDIETLIVFGVRPESQRNMDTNKKRTAGNMLALAGEDAVTSVPLAQALANVLAYEAGRYTAIGAAGNLYTHIEIEKVLAVCGSIRESIPFAAGTKPLIPAGISIFAHYYASAVNKEMADAFWAQLESELGFEITSPVYQLHRKLNDHRNKVNRLSRKEIVAYIILAFNLYVQGKTVTKLVWRTKGKNPQPFPLFVDLSVAKAA